MKSHTFVVAWEDFTWALEDLTRLKIVPLFREANAMGIVLEGDDQTIEVPDYHHSCFEDA